MLTAAAKINSATPSFSRLSPFKTLIMRRGNSDARQHGSRGRCIGRRDDGSERDGGRQRHSLQSDRRPGDGRGRQDHGHSRQCHQRPPIPPQLTWRQIERRIQQRRRDEQRQRQFRLDDDVRGPGQQGHDHAGDGQHGRVRARRSVASPAAAGWRRTAASAKFRKMPCVRALRVKVCGRLHSNPQAILTLIL